MYKEYLKEELQQAENHLRYLERYATESEKNIGLYNALRYCITSLERRIIYIKIQMENEKRE